MKYNFTKHKELLEKFQKKKQTYLMVLGGANKNDAEKFNIEKYKITIRKKHSELNKTDCKLLNLTTAYIAGEYKFKNMSKDKIPYYFKILENIENKERANLINISNEPVYNFLNNLENKICELVVKKNNEKLKDEIRETNWEEEKISYALNSKQEFVNSIADFMKRRTSIKPLIKSDWFYDSKLNQKRYNLILNLLIHSSSKTKNLEEFVFLLPNAPWERFDWEKFSELI